MYPRRRQQHSEYAARIQSGAHRRHRTPMHSYEIAHDGESDATAAFGQRRGRIDLHEQLEDARELRRFDADARIADADARPLLRAVERQGNLAAVARVLAGVDEQ